MCNLPQRSKKSTSKPLEALDESVSSTEGKLDTPPRNLTSILKHEDSPRAKYTKGLRFQDTSSDEEKDVNIKRMTRRRVITTRSKAQKNGVASNAEM